MVLSDHTIKEELARGHIIIDPLNPEDIQPASVDVHLDRKLLVFRNTRSPYIDVRKRIDDLTDMIEIEGDEAFALHPGEFVLASTAEHIEIPGDLVAELAKFWSIWRPSFWSIFWTLFGTFWESIFGPFWWSVFGHF